MIKKICFVGQVDSGKSTIAGRLFAECGGLSKHELEQIQKDMINKKTQLWSSILDIYSEERERGKTNEFSIISFKYNNIEYNIIDNPGHQIYIRSLIEGISSFNANEIIGCIVISIRNGEFKTGWENGQTKEDIILTRAVGIRNIIVLINKMDTIDWSEEEFNKIKKHTISFISSCKFDSVSYIPISGYNGIGLVQEYGMPYWYKDKCLMDTIEKIELKNNIVSKILLPSKWSYMICNIQIVELHKISLIARGFKCILHYNGYEYNVTFEDISLINKPTVKFLKNKDIGKIYIKSEIPIIKRIDKNDTINVIFRYNENTIGFGRILEIIE